ncbi:hypothetical protein KFK09_014174 [Dendrobium nobile]|uniref:Mediator of RNA polymerase II transcription subunit 9 n=1 Tax=Dendrobium nobile TaxID=94219 RepID=A0A8T3B974_DENNO|nr:hypothetical protein KFK09_014174 [Dendrobium nobile]
MDHHFGLGSWMMVPTQNTIPHDHSSLQAQYYQQQQQQQQHLLPQQLQQQQQEHHDHNHHQSLASHFHLLHLAESLAEAVGSGTRDQQSEALMNELTNHFDKCQQLLNSILGSITTKAMTVEGQKRKQEETKLLLNQRKELIAKYRSSVEELLNADLSR